jgi:thiol:disulfide interchange protein DsbA
MKFARRSFVSTIFALGAALTVARPSLAQTAGKDYTPISPAQPTDDAAKVEVLEFFSYGCPHCADFNPLVTAWAAKLPADVVFKKGADHLWACRLGEHCQAVLHAGNHRRSGRLEADVFRPIHGEKINLFEAGALTEWVVKKGVDQKKFTDTFKSFGVMSKVKRGDQMAQAFKIQGVPALAVDGKFMVGGKDFAEQLAIADKLIVKARSEKSGKK